jgi:hypothetical protein
MTSAVKASVFQARQSPAFFSQKIFFIPRKKKLSSVLMMASFLQRKRLQAKTGTLSGFFLQ